MSKFKVGDRVQNLSKNSLIQLEAGERNNHGKYGVVVECIANPVDRNLHGELIAIRVRYDDGSRGAGAELGYELAPAQFILQYELDSDPFEIFSTMKEVEARIKELAKRADLKRESVKVYEIAKTYDVKLETHVSMSTAEEKQQVEKRENALFGKKRGRPSKQKHCDICGKIVKSLGHHKRWNHSN